MLDMIFAAAATISGRSPGRIAAIASGGSPITALAKLAHRPAGDARVGTRVEPVQEGARQLVRLRRQQRLLDEPREARVGERSLGGDPLPVASAAAKPASSSPDLGSLAFAITSASDAKILPWKRNDMAR
jgi:hypothetical protein